MELSFSRVGGMLLAIFSFIQLSWDTFFNKILRWLSMGPFLEFVHANYDILASLCVVIIALKWIKHAYALILVWLSAYLVFLFII